MNPENINRELLIASFDPFIHPDNYEGMIIGNDIDSILSACYLKKRFGWNVVATYDYQTIWHSGKHKNFLHEFINNKFVSVDLDINNINNYSIGHHILKLRPTDNIPNHFKSLNPNLIRNVDVSNFRRKYPLGTIHLLTWLFDEQINSRESHLMIWLADSAFINGQSHRFRSNVSEWLSNFFKFEQFSSTFNEIDSQNFELEMKSKIFQNLSNFRICNNYGQVKSRHLNLSGFQCQWRNPNESNALIKSLISFVAKTTGWLTPNFPDNFLAISGQRSTIDVGSLITQYGCLDEFLKKKDVFSYVFPYANAVNFTTGIIKKDLDDPLSWN